MRLLGPSAALALTLATSLAVAATAPAVAARAADATMTPDYEVKLLLDPADVLTSSHVPTAALDSYLGLGSAQTRSYQYLDTDAQALDAEGWSIRERRIGSSGSLQLNYKHRWAITGGDVDAALDQARDDGFDASDDNYDAEVDWGYSKQTLSIATDKSHSGGFSGTLPTGSTAVDIAVDEIPGKLDDWRSKGWGGDTLSASRVHGPVTSKQYEGTLDGHDVDVEVVAVRDAAGTGTEYLVELSFKDDEEGDAADDRSSAISGLDARRWLLHQDSLKTSLILDRY